MSTASAVYSTTQQPRPSGRSIGALATIFRKETKYEFLKLLRNKQFSLATIGFPVMF
jgi:ABC-2 type transport system permease protein